MWQYEIIATDLLGQIGSLSIDIRVIQWAQTDCIRWSGPKQSDWEIWADGYILDNNTGTWYFIDYTNSFSSSKFLFITLIVLINIILSLVAFIFGIQSEVWSLVVYTNQSLLLWCLMEFSVSNNFLNFLSVLQLTKMDFKFLDLIFNSRNAIDSVFYKEQFVSMKELNFDSGSTFANFINLFFLFIIGCILLSLFKLIKKPDVESKTTSYLSYFHKLFDATIFVSVFKLSSAFIMMNWFSEFLNQINLNSEKGDIFSYTICDFIMILLLILALFIHKFKPSNSIFTSEFLISYERFNIIKMYLFSLLFIFQNSWKLYR